MRFIAALLAAFVVVLLATPAAHAQFMTQVTGRAPWGNRREHGAAVIPLPITFTAPSYMNSTASITLPPYSMVVFGGITASTTYLNNTWATSDGTNWHLISGTDMQSSMGVVTSPNRQVIFDSRRSSSTYHDRTGRIYNIAGRRGDVFHNEVWTSENGVVWQQMSNGPFFPRQRSTAWTDPEGVVYFANGMFSNKTMASDVWRSTNNGSTWTAVTRSVPFSPRQGLDSFAVYSPGVRRNVHYIMNGEPIDDGLVYLNDIWVSSDNGAAWTRLTNAAAYSGRYDSEVLVSNAGVMIVTGGDTYAGNRNDVWASLDGGYTWGLCTNAAGYAVREDHTVVLDSAGYLMLFGGELEAGGYGNDVWRSTISFNNVAQVASSCGLSVPRCGVGLMCWPIDFTCQLECASSFMQRFTNAANWGPRTEQGLAVYPQPLTFTSTENIGYPSTTVTLKPPVLVLYGGRVSSVYENDTWASDDDGANWWLMSGTNARGRAAPQVSPNSAGQIIDGRRTADCYDSTGRMYIIAGRYGSDYTSRVSVSTNGGVSWTVATAAAGFVGRERGTCWTDPRTNAVYFGTGEVASTDQVTKDIWKSTDGGSTWTQTTATPAFPVRQGGDSIAVYSNKYGRTIHYLMNGEPTGNGGFLNDIWVSSDDAVTWTKLTEAPYPPRYDAELVVSRESNAMVIISGDSTVDNLNDVWASLDGGITWGACIVNAGFAIREDHSAVLDSNGYLLIMGGDVAGAGTNDIWRSIISFHDPAQVARACNLRFPKCDPGLQCWPGSNDPCCGTASVAASSPAGTFMLRSVTQAAAWPVRYEHGVSMLTKAVTLRNPSGVATDFPANSLVVYTGRDVSVLNDVWISSDVGATWTLIGGTARFPSSTLPSSYASSAAVDSARSADCWDRNGRMYLIGGRFSGAFSQRVIASDDGATWTMMPTPAWPARERSMCWSDSNNNIYVAGGLTSLTSTGLPLPSNDVWRTTNGGQTWVQMTATAAWHGRQGHDGKAVFLSHFNRDIHYVMNGDSSWGTFNDIWVSSDSAATWQRLSYAAPYQVRKDGELTVTKDGVLIVTGGDNGPGNVNDIWASLDGGYTWGACSLAAPYIPREDHVVLIDPYGYLVLAGGDSIEGNRNDVWTSSISFFDLTAVQKACRVSLSSCGVGLRCWPGDASCATTCRSSFNDGVNVLVVPNTGNTLPGGGNSGAGGSTIVYVSSSDDLSKGAIAGIVIGVVVGAIVLAVALYVCLMQVRGGKAGGHHTLSSPGTTAESELSVVSRNNA